MKLFLYPNHFNEEQNRLARDIISVLEQQGNSCALSASDSEALYGDDRKAAQAADCDLVVSIGGDGAVLRAAQPAFAADRPLIGINCGRLGYLCAIERSEAAFFNEFFEKCHISRRAMLLCESDGGSAAAMNDVVISKKDFGLSVSLDMTVDGAICRNYRGDGIIISTPTGSTAYNRSAGGPVVACDCDVLAVTPINVSAGSASPLIVRSSSVIAVSRCNEPALVFTDGQLLCPLNGTVRVSAAPRMLSLYVRDI